MKPGPVFSVRAPVSHAQRVVQRAGVQLELDVTVLAPAQKRASCGSNKTCSTCGNSAVCSGFCAIGQLGHKS